MIFNLTFGNILSSKQRQDERDCINLLTDGASRELRVNPVLIGAHYESDIVIAGIGPDLG